MSILLFVKGKIGEMDRRKRAGVGALKGPRRLWGPDTLWDPSVCVLV